MNPWYAQLADDCMAEHDRVCINGAECKQRKVHIESAYIAPALRHRVEALQGQVAQAEVERDQAQVDRVRELLTKLVDEYGDPVYQGNGWAEGVRDAAREALKELDGDAVVLAADIRRALEG